MAPTDPGGLRMLQCVPSPCQGCATAGRLPVGITPGKGPEKKQQLSFFPSLSSLLASEQCCWREERSWERLSQPLCALCFHFETHLLQPSCWHRMRPLSSPSSPSVVTGGGHWVLTGAAQRDPQPYPVPFWMGITQPAAGSCPQHHPFAGHTKALCVCISLFLFEISF